MTRYFGLTLLFSLPAYVLIALTGMNIILSPDKIFSFIPLAVLAPLGASSYLTYKKGGWTAVKIFLRRSFDYKRIKERKGYVVFILLMPILFLIAWGVGNTLEMEMNPPLFPMVLFIVPLIMYFFSALSEQIGWMGYAYEPLKQQYGIFKATSILGVFWALWHLPMYIFLFPNVGMLIAQLVAVVMLRFSIVWLFENTNKSVFIAILIHAIYNVCMSIFPVSFVLNAIGFTIFALIIMAHMLKKTQAVG